MGTRTLAVVHAEPRIAWQAKRAAYFAEGFRARGIPYRITSDRVRQDEGFAVLLGTTLWRDCERRPDFLLVDRCSFGDTERFVSLVWNGHGRRGDHRVPPQVRGDRWRKYGQELAPWRTGSRTVLCGQTEAYSPTPLESFYRTPATHFRPHPAGDNPTGLPVFRNWDDVGQAITLNSSVGVAAVMAGVPTVAMDEGSMAWNVSGHSPGEIVTPDRVPWCEWLAWTQWTDDEIKEGAPWAYHL